MYTELVCLPGVVPDISCSSTTVKCFGAALLASNLCMLVL